MKENIIKEILLKNRNLSAETKVRLPLMNETQLTFLLDQSGQAPQKSSKITQVIIIAVLISFSFVALIYGNV
jgi:hypothetical protein